jgi:sensor histidine kinase YesM
MTRRVQQLLLVIRTLLASGAVWTTVAAVHAASVWSDAVRRGRAPTLASLVDGYLVAYAPWVPFAAALYLLHSGESDTATGAGQPPTRYRMRHWRVLFLNVLFLIVELAYQAALLQDGSSFTVASLGRGLRDMPALFKLIDTALLLSTNAVVFTLVAMRRQRDMIESQRALQADHLRLQLSLEQQRLQGLRAQLEPHFLYNALNAISGLVRNDDRGTALTALQQLSRLLRYATEAVSKEWVTLTDEVAFLDEYLALQQLRFGSRLVVHREGGEHIPAAQECLPLLLQPLAENAIRHGVEVSVEPTTLSVRFYRTGPRTVIWIANSIPADATPNPGLGIGLTVLRERLRAAYGDEATLDTVASTDRYEVTLTLPTDDDGHQS